MSGSRLARVDSNMARNLSPFTRRRAPPTVRMPAAAVARQRLAAMPTRLAHQQQQQQPFLSMHVNLFTVSVLVCMIILIIVVAALAAQVGRVEHKLGALLMTM